MNDVTFLEVQMYVQHSMYRFGKGLLFKHTLYKDSDNLGHRRV